MTRWNIVAVVACLFACAAALRADVASAQTPSDTPLRVTQTWDGPVSYCADATVLPSDVSSATFLDWIQQAMDAWNAIDADVQLILTGACAQPWALDNMRNEVAFEAYPPNAAEVGLTYSTSLGHRVLEADVTLSLGWDDPIDTCWRHVLVHEFGHALGFTHSVNGTDVMGYGPCGVVAPSESEVDLLAAAYGRRPAPLEVMTAAPDGTSTLSLIGTRREYEGEPGVYYFTPSVTVAGGGAILLRAPACFTDDAPSIVECAEETTYAEGYWPRERRDSGLSEVNASAGRSTVRTATSLDHWAAPLLVCNTVGCAAALDVRMGDVRANGSGIDFGYLVVPMPNGEVRVEVVNLSFVAPPALPDAPATFEIRRAGVDGTTGRIESCSLRPGRSCAVQGDFGGLTLEVVHVDAELSARTGVSIRAVEAIEGSTPVVNVTPPSGALVLGSLPTRGVGLVLWGGGPVTLAEGDARIGAVFVSRGGVLRGYIVGAPGFVNAGFLSAMGEEIAANTPVVIVVR